MKRSAKIPAVAPSLVRATRLVALLIAACSFYACGDDPTPSSGQTGGEAGQEHGSSAGSSSVPGECGDGRLSGAEECDDGNVEPGDGCDDDCRVEASDPACGDGQRDSGEECDDGDLSAGDGCDGRCREERCGNERIDAGEECDPPVSGECTARCNTVSANCGDGTVQEDEGEQCDDRNDVPDDGCHECRQQCGNGRIDGDLGEECDPLISSAGRCSGDCKWLPACGDGEVQASAGEECDPSNGQTCVNCRHADPHPPGCGGAGGAEGGGEGGCGGGGTDECVPEGGSNLIQNGTFTTDTTGWLSHSQAISVQSASDGSPEPRSLEVAFDSGPVRGISGAVQCLPVLPGRLYDFRAQYRIPADAPSGTGAAVTVLLYAGTRCDGPYLPPVGSGPEGRVRDAWTPYQYTLNTAALGTSEGRALVRLGVVRPANATGARVLWDSASLSEPGSSCGNCVRDEGETCDDGNQRPGDGCGPTCLLEICGDGSQEPGEDCDDGNTIFGGAGDSCTPSCREPSDCDECASGSCNAGVTACLGLTRVAQAGRRAGSPLSTLCDELRACVERTSCQLAQRTISGVTGAFLENCYCGTSGSACFNTPGAANGSCRREVEAALEATDPSTLLSRISGSSVDHPVFAALRELVACETLHCAASCVRQPECGDGFIQDRNLDYTFIIDRTEVPCADNLTFTGRGCSVEECDDGNSTPGDGCDEQCFLERCGNNVVQAGEDCDDGNRASGDGCSATCVAEFTCGNGELQPPFEECEPEGDPGTKACTPSEYQANPSQCACDDKCARVVCGNGVRQPPLEECDPLNDVACGSDCTRPDVSPCEVCISENPELGPVDLTYCNVSAECVAVKRCVINEQCFSPIPATCYCGDVADPGVIRDICGATGFVPTGPCRDVIRAGLGGGSLANITVLDRLTDFNYPTGVAMLVLDEATRVCANDCVLAAP